MVAYRIDPTDALPLHYQLQRQLRSAIHEGQLRPGDMLPPELLITRQTGISRTTVRRAMDELVHEGLIVRERGRGTFVAQPRTPPPVTARTVVFAPPLDVPYRAARLIGIALTTPPAEAGEKLGLNDGLALHIARLLLSDDRPCAVERITLPPLPWDAAKEAALDDSRLLELAERSLDVHITHAQVRLTPVAVDEESATLLGATPGVPALAVERCVYAGQRMVECRRMIVHGETAGVEIATPRDLLFA